MLKNHTAGQIVTVLVFLITTTNTHATLFNANYTLVTGDVITFMLDGSVEADLDTVVVNSILMTPEFNGTTPPLGLISGFQSTTDATNAVPLSGPIVAPALLSISGSSMDFVYFNDGVSLTDGFLFTTDFAPPVFTAGISYGNTFENFDTAAWTLTEKQPSQAPAPGTIALMGLGLMGLLGFGRRQHRR